MSATTTRLLENYVGGRWTPAADPSEILDVTNPASGEVLARVPMSGRADLDRAVAAARAALPAWRDVSTIARARKLFELRARLDARSEDLARSVTIEMGKTIGDARAEVARMIEMVEAACAIPTTMQGRVLEDVARNVDAETVRQPVGVCAAIVPFNFPAMVPFWFLPFAIACGRYWLKSAPSPYPTIGGCIKIEYQTAGGAWTDYTWQILNLGFTGRDIAPPGSYAGSDGATAITYNSPGVDQLPTLPINTPAGNPVGFPAQGPVVAGHAPATIPVGCTDPSPNAIIRLARVRDNPSYMTTKCTTAITKVNFVASDFWPMALYDTREGTYRQVDVTPASFTLVVLCITLSSTPQTWQRGSRIIRVRWV